MAASTYLTLVNKLLRRFNEVELTSSTFGNARGVHATAKDAILTSLNTIHQQNWKWPFNYVIDTSANDILLVVGTNTYDYPTSASGDAEDIDIENVYLEKDAALNVNAVRLIDITHDEYKRYLRDNDLNASASSGYNVPKYVYKTPDLKIGVSPKPDKAYTIIVPYWQIPAAPSAFSDTTPIDSRFDDVIVDGGEPHMYAQRKNETQRKSAQDNFQDQIKRMRKLLINTDNDIRSTQIIIPRGRSLLYLDTN